MLVICLLNNIVLRGREFCTSSIAQITGNAPRLLADIVGWKTIEDVIQYELQIIAYKSRNGLAPRYLYNMFVANSFDSSYNLQNLRQT